MCCHLAGSPERLAVDPKLNQGLRRKNQLGLVCSSTDYKGSGDFFYLLLWYRPNHGCQFSPLLPGSPSTFSFCFYLPSSVPDFCFVWFCFSFSSCGCLPSALLHLTPSVLIPILLTDKKHCTVQNILLMEINRLSENEMLYDGVNLYSVLF